jgi:hydroxyacylglutathione hydrolase
MFDRFTDRARKVMALARKEAQRFKHDFIGTEHILLGLIQEGSGVAAKVLKNLGTEINKIRSEIEKNVQAGPSMVTMGQLPFTPRAKKVLELSMEEANELGHNYIGTEHLLLGLIREQDGVAAQVLLDLNLKLEDVRADVLDLLGAEAQGSPAELRPSLARAQSVHKTGIPFHRQSTIPPGFILEQLRTGGDRNFGYLLGDRDAGKAVLVDPSFNPDALVERARVQGLEVIYILNTHGHPDHTNGNARARELTGAPVAAWKGPAAPQIELADGQLLHAGALEIEVLWVPGHAPDHIFVYLLKEGVALTGDLLFVGKVGGTRSNGEAREEYRSLARLDHFPEDTTIWPGHDYGCRPSSTLAIERATNPFLRAASFPEFLELKRNWPEYKARHGLR